MTFLKECLRFNEVTLIKTARTLGVFVQLCLLPFKILAHVSCCGFNEIVRLTTVYGMRGLNKGSRKNTRA